MHHVNGIVVKWVGYSRPQGIDGGAKAGTLPSHVTSHPSSRNSENAIVVNSLIPLYITDLAFLRL